MRLLWAAIVIGALGVSEPLGAQLKNPVDWKWRLDEPANLVTSLDVPKGSWLFVMMPPGWHITTGPGAVLSPSEFPAIGGNYSLEAQIFLFPGESLEEYGVFIGGRDVDDRLAAEYAALVIRRDGQAAVIARTPDGAANIAAWRPHPAIVAGGAGPDPVKNVIRVDVDPRIASLWVNGAKVLDVPRAELRTAGRVGFRVGKNLNLHITNLDVTQRLAPQPVGKVTH